MERSSLAEQVLQRMKEKKELEQKNKPHNDILKLEVVFVREHNKHLRQEITSIQAQIKEKETLLTTLQDHTQELDNTGKKMFPRIIIRSDFVASQKIKADVKQFLRKSSNTFLREQILRHRRLAISEDHQQQLLDLIAQYQQLKSQLKSKAADNIKNTNSKRMRNLQQDLRLRKINQQIQDLQQEIAQERQQNIELIKEYQLKKENADERKQRLIQVEKSINYYQKQIENNYNPIAYRLHLRQLFDLQIKNELLVKNLENVRQKVQTLEAQTEKCQKSLSKNKVFEKIGKIFTARKTLRRKVHMQTQSFSFFDKPDRKILPPKSFQSISFTQASYMANSKQIGQKKPKKDKYNNSGSPKNSLNESEKSSFPRYRSAFSRRIG